MSNIQSYSLFYFLILMVTVSYSQSHMDEYHAETEEFKHFRVAMNIGHGYIPSASKENNTAVVLPTWGLDLEYWFTEKWGMGFKGDVEIANYIIEREGEEEHIEREKPLILTTTAFIKPWETNGFIFFAGPGIEIEKEENFFVTRLGVAYEMHLPHHWDVAPEFIYDLKSGFVNSYTIAIGIGKRF